MDVFVFCMLSAAVQMTCRGINVYTAAQIYVPGRTYHNRMDFINVNFVPLNNQKHLQPGLAVHILYLPLTSILLMGTDSKFPPLAPGQVNFEDFQFI